MAKTNYDKKYIDHMNPFCTNCSADLTLQKGFEDTLKAWICEECGAALTGPAMDIEDMRFPGVVQICDDCGAILNNQPGFTDYEDFWTCTKCGTVVPIGEDDNFSSEESRKFISDGEAEGSMTVKEARMIEQEFYDNRNPSEDDEFLYVEAMDFLITEENDPQDMMNLGGYYYEQRRFELARKYYEMASAFDIDAADECLGYIWYYGRTGEKDYKKAYEHKRMDKIRDHARDFIAKREAPAVIPNDGKQTPTKGCYRPVDDVQHRPSREARPSGFCALATSQSASSLGHLATAAFSEHLCELLPSTQPQPVAGNVSVNGIRYSRAGN